MMPYRSKSAARAFDELVHLSVTYPHCSIAAVDNILDMKYFQTLLPALAAAKLDLELFYEVKANLKKEHVRLLMEAGVKAIQPGVENFSNGILRRMGKG